MYSKLKPDFTVLIWFLILLFYFCKKCESGAFPFTCKMCCNDARIFKVVMWGLMNGSDSPGWGTSFVQKCNTYRLGFRTNLLLYGINN